MPAPTIVYLVGPSGCGKTTVGKLLAAKGGGLYLDGDDFHPPGNKEKMGAGVPLEDEDRRPWLAAIATTAVEKSRAQAPVFVACSALKRAYRDCLRDLVEAHSGKGSVRFVWLDGRKELIASRIAGRRHAYMPPSLLDSQFATFEPPTVDEGAIRVGIAAEPEAIADEILARLGD